MGKAIFFLRDGCHSADFHARSTLFVSNLPYSATSSDLQALFSDLAPVRHAFVVLEPGSSVSKGVGYVSFSVKEDAEAAINHVASEGMTLHGRKLRVHWAEAKVQQRLKDNPPPKPKKPVTSSSGPSRANRLIVRNLPWDITEEDLHALFSPFGAIYSIHLPTSEADSPRKKGFAFVWMSKKGDAEKAIAGCNGRTVRAGSKVGEKKKKKKRAENRVSPGNEKDDGGSDVAITESGGRVIAVDWALSKERWNKEKEKMEESEEESELSADSEHGSQGDDDEEEADENELTLPDESLGETSDQSDGESGESSTSARNPSAGPPPPPEGTTLFARNIPFEATEDELRVLCVFILSI
jgi:nucleolar protein 4